MNVREFPSTERLIASSDFELKLVTIKLLGTVSVPSRVPLVVRLSRKIGEVMPKLPSVAALFQTLCESFRFGNPPLSLATPQVTITGVVPPAMRGTLTVVVPFGPPAQPSGKV